MKHTQRSLAFIIVFVLMLGVLSPANANAATLSSSSVRGMVQNYFKDVPEMVKVAECESGFRQFDESGNVLRGGYGDMIGVFQIDESVHRDAALAMGYDIDTFIGNILYTRYLYSQEGVNPWIGCVGNSAIGGGNNAPATVAVVEKKEAPKEILSTPTLSNIRDQRNSRHHRAHQTLS